MARRDAPLPPAWKTKLNQAGKSFDWRSAFGLARRDDWAGTLLRSSPPSSHEAKVRRFFKNRKVVRPSRVSAQPVQPVFICFTQRSGSSLLAELLASTGELPQAKGNFSWQVIVKHSKRNKYGSFEQYCASLVWLRRGNGFFACKASAAQLSFLTKEKLIPKVFAAPRFIHLRRRDVLAQAISFVIARQTGQWNIRKQVKAEEPVYDAAAIAARVRAIAAANAWFEDYFALFGFPVFEVVYEDLAADPAATISDITEWLGLGPSQIDRERTSLKPQRNALNDEWRSRFLDESRQYFGGSGELGVAAAPVSRR